MQYNAFDRGVPRQFNLDPFLYIGVCSNLAVVAVLGRTQWSETFFQIDNRRVCVSQFLSACNFNFALERSACSVQLSQSTGQFSSAVGGLGMNIVLAVSSIHCRKYRLQPIVIFLRDRVELVVVASRTLHGQTAKCIEDS